MHFCQKKIQAKKFFQNFFEVWKFSDATTIAMLPNATTCQTSFSSDWNFFKFKDVKILTIIMSVP